MGLDRVSTKTSFPTPIFSFKIHQLHVGEARDVGVHRETNGVSRFRKLKRVNVITISPIIPRITAFYFTNF